MLSLCFFRGLLGSLPRGEGCGLWANVSADVSRRRCQLCFLNAINKTGDLPLYSAESFKVPSGSPGTCQATKVISIWMGLHSPCPWKGPPRSSCGGTQWFALNGINFKSPQTYPNVDNLETFNRGNCTFIARWLGYLERWKALMFKYVWTSESCLPVLRMEALSLFWSVFTYYMLLESHSLDPTTQIIHDCGKSGG